LKSLHPKHYKALEIPSIIYYINTIDTYPISHTSPFGTLIIVVWLLTWCRAATPVYISRRKNFPSKRFHRFSSLTRFKNLCKLLFILSVVV